MKLVQRDHAVTIEVQTSISIFGPWYNQVTGITRSDKNGRRPVRITDIDLKASAQAGKLIVIDYEPAAGIVEYIAHVDGEADQPATITMNIEQPLLHSVVYPQVRSTVNILAGYSRERELTVQPIACAAGTWTTFNGARAQAARLTLSIDAATFPTARRIESLFETVTPLMLRQSDHHGLDSYLLPTATTIEARVPNGRQTLWAVKVDAVEIDFPAPNDVRLRSAAFATYQDFIDKFGIQGDQYNDIETLFWNRTYSDALTDLVWWI